MANLVSISDFTGEISLGVGNDPNAQKPVTDLITDYESKFLSQMLGFALKDEVYASTYVGGVVAPSAELTKIFNPLEDETGCHRIESLGIKNTLKYMLYLKIVQSQMRKNTAFGNVQSEVSVSIPSSNIEVHLAYNRGVKSAKSIQQYCIDNADKYPTFKGIELKYSSFI